MPTRRRPFRQAFTLIELVAVLVVLAILSAVALPRFLDLSGDAHRSAMKGVIGGVSEGLSNAIMRYSVGDTAGLPPDADANGFPDNLGDVADDEPTIFDGILDPPLTVTKNGWKPYPVGFPMGSYYIYIYDTDGDGVFDYPDEGYIIYLTTTGQIYTYVPSN